MQSFIIYETWPVLRVVVRKRVHPVVNSYVSSNLPFRLRFILKGLSEAAQKIPLQLKEQQTEGRLSFIMFQYSLGKFLSLLMSMMQGDSCLALSPNFWDQNSSPFVRKVLLRSQLKLFDELSVYIRFGFFKTPIRSQGLFNEPASLNGGWEIVLIISYLPISSSGSFSLSPSLKNLH